MTEFQKSHAHTTGILQLESPEMGGQFKPLRPIRQAKSLTAR
ncbi:hypothetical protein QN347_17210 [Sphingomonas sp. 10B4]|nr:hypothetical protein [Sphingomonas sp. 10B4]